MKTDFYGHGSRSVCFNVKAGRIFVALGHISLIMNKWWSAKNSSNLQSAVGLYTTSILWALINQQIELETSRFCRNICLIAAFLIKYHSLSSKFAANPQREVSLFNNGNMISITTNNDFAVPAVNHLSSCHLLCYTGCVV